LYQERQRINSNNKREGKNKEEGENKRQSKPNRKGINKEIEGGTLGWYTKSPIR